MRRLAAIVESSDDAVIGKDLNGIVTSWNLGAERMFGYAAKEMVGRPITTIVPAELHEDERRILKTIGRGNASSTSRQFDLPRMVSKSLYP